MAIRKCPYCKSNAGFKIHMTIGGWQESTVSFSGKIIHSKREGTDTVERYGTCIKCGEHIDRDLLNIENV